MKGLACGSDWHQDHCMAPCFDSRVFHANFLWCSELQMTIRSTLSINYDSSDTSADLNQRTWNHDMQLQLSFSLKIAQDKPLRTYAKYFVIQPPRSQPVCSKSVFEGDQQNIAGHDLLWKAETSGNLMEILRVCHKRTTINKLPKMRSNENFPSAVRSWSANITKFSVRSGSADH